MAFNIFLHVFLVIGLKLVFHAIKIKIINKFCQFYQFSAFLIIDSINRYNDILIDVMITFFFLMSTVIFNLLFLQL